MDNNASATRYLENFINKVTRKMASPLISELPKLPPTKALLPLRNKHPAAQSLSRVPGSKRDEILMM